LNLFRPFREGFARALQDRLLVCGERAPSLPLFRLSREVGRVEEGLRWPFFDHFGKESLVPCKSDLCFTAKGPLRWPFFDCFWKVEGSRRAFVGGYSSVAGRSKMVIGRCAPTNSGSPDASICVFDQHRVALNRGAVSRSSRPIELLNQEAATAIQPAAEKQARADPEAASDALKTQFEGLRASTPNGLGRPRASGRKRERQGPVGAHANGL